MLVVLKAFPWSPDGARVQLLQPGDNPAIQSDLIEGLVKEGYLSLDGKAAASAALAATPTPPPPAPAGAPPLPNAVEIPPKWRDLTWFQLKALAEKVSRGAGKDKTTATAAIEAELTRRAAG